MFHPSKFYLIFYHLCFCTQDECCRVQNGAASTALLALSLLFSKVPDLSISTIHDTCLLCYFWSRSVSSPHKVKLNNSRNTSNREFLGWKKIIYFYFQSFDKGLKSGSSNEKDMSLLTFTPCLNIVELRTQERG